jgi:riboflavin kinase/FMN adenylyltransferase
MRLLDCLRPKFGVYAVRASVLQDDKVEARRLGVASFGVRPMFRVSEPLLETWLFDFDGDLYGKHLSVELVSYLRPELELPDLDALRARIGADAQAARAALDRAGVRC